MLNEVGVSCPAELPIVGGAVEASLEAAVETRHSYEYVASTLRWAGNFFVRISNRTKASSTVHNLIVPLSDKFRLELRAAFGRQTESAFDRHSLADVLKPHLACQLLRLTELWKQ